MTEASGPRPLYDNIGDSYATTRRPDPRVTARIHTALGDAHRVLNVGAGVAELRRVAARVDMLTFDTGFVPWIASDYLPAIIGQDQFIFPPIDEVAAWLDADIRVVPVPRDCTDGFMGAYWARPELYLDPHRRAGMSAVRKLDPSVVEAGMEQLKTDLDSGAWDAKWGHLRSLDELDLGYRLLVTR